MGTNWAPLLADLFLYSYEAEFVQKLLQDNNKKLAVSFNHTFRYIDDVLSINNHNFHNYVHLIYPDELEKKDTTESDKSASYLDILLDIHYMTNMIILTLQLSTFLFYVVTYMYHFHLLMVCMSPS
jgi:type IV secretory pathway VirB6-like protein